MSPVLIVLIVLVVVAVIALVAAGPGLQKKEGNAVAHVKEVLGADRITRIDSRVTGMGTEPEEAGGQRGMGVLALSADDLLFSTWSGKDLRIARSAIVRVETENEDPATAHKLTIRVVFTGAEGEATAMFRLADAIDWLTELGYDWGPEGPPVADEGDAAEA